jgi:WD40 repeat protein
VKVWSVCVCGKEAASGLAGDASYVLSVAFSPDGQHIVSGSGFVVKFLCTKLHFTLFLIYANNQICL